MSALRTRGVVTFVAEDLVKSVELTLVLAWCEYAGKHPGMGPGAVVDAIRRGQQPPAAQGRSRDEQAEYGERIREWLEAKLPDACRQDERLVMATRRVFGDADADGLAASRSPHPSAVAAVIRLHHKLGRGRLTVREHGSEIRAAVRAADDRAVADLGQIEQRRRKGDGSNGGTREVVGAAPGGSAEGERDPVSEGKAEAGNEGEAQGGA